MCSQFFAWPCRASGGAGVPGGVVLPGRPEPMAPASTGAGAGGTLAHASWKVGRVVLVCELGLQVELELGVVLHLLAAELQEEQRPFL